MVLKFRAALDDNKFAKLVADIQNHDHTYPLVIRSDGGKGGKFPDLLVEQYLSIFESNGYLVRDNLVITRMAFSEFSYDMEKAWCNADVQRVIAQARKADKSTIRPTRFLASLKSWPAIISPERANPAKTSIIND